MDQKRGDITSSSPQSRLQERRLEWTARGEEGSDDRDSEQEYPGADEGRGCTANAGMYGGGEEAEADEEEAEGELEEEWKERSDLEDFPLGHGGASILAGAKALSRRRIVDRKVLAEPLLHEDAERRGREAEEEARKPEDIYANGP